MMSIEEFVEKSITEQIIDELFVSLSVEEEFSDDVLEKLKDVAQKGKLTQINLVKSALKAEEQNDEIA